MNGAAKEATHQDLERWGRRSGHVGRFVSGSSAKPAAAQSVATERVYGRVWVSVKAGDATAAGLSAALRNALAARPAALAPVPSSVLRVWELARLPAGWDGRDAPPPSPIACEFARRFAMTASVNHTPPARVVGDVEGGIALYWFGAETLVGGSHRRVASISVGNDGEVAVVLEDRSVDTREAFDVSLDNIGGALARVTGFVGAGGATR